jgi:RNA-binding protein
VSELTSKQKAFLRGIGQTIECSIVVGKGGISEGLLSALRDVLARQELVKVKIPAGPGPMRDQCGAELAAGAGAELLGVVGRTALLYKPNPDLPAEKRISV